MRLGAQPTRKLSSEAFSLDDLLEKNKYGGEAKSAKNAASLESLMGKHRYGGDKNQAAIIKDIAPEYPHDIDVGPLFCIKANRCFLDGGKRCGQYQSGNRNKGMLQDLHTASSESGFFFMHSTIVEDYDLTVLYDHMSDLDRGHAKWEMEPVAQGDEGRGFFPVGDHAKAGIPAKHGGFRMGKPGSTYSVANAWPQRERFQEDMERYYDKIDHVADQLLKAFADLFGLESDALQKLRSANSASDLELLQFPGDEEAANVYTEEYRTAPGVFALFNHTEPILQVQDVKGEWCNVRVGSERFVVLIGEALERLTNGAVPATKFKITPAHHERQAIKFSARLDPTALIAPLPDFGDPLPQYATPVTQLDLLERK